MYVLSSFHDGSLTPGDCNNFHGFYGQLSADYLSYKWFVRGSNIIVYDVQHSDSV